MTRTATVSELLDEAVALQSTTLVLRNLLSLPKLRVLNLSDNRISSLDGVDQLSGLESLDISFNRVRHLPPGLSSLPRLKTLDLSANSFARFPVHDGDYPVLQELRLSGNPIGTMPSQLWSHPTLECLYLDPEQAKTVPAHVRSRGRPVIQVE